MQLTFTRLRAALTGAAVAVALAGVVDQSASAAAPVADAAVVPAATPCGIDAGDVNAGYAPAGGQVTVTVTVSDQPPLCSFAVYVTSHSVNENNAPVTQLGSESAFQGEFEAAGGSLTFTLPIDPCRTRVTVEVNGAFTTFQLAPHFIISDDPACAPPVDTEPPCMELPVGYAPPSTVTDLGDGHANVAFTLDSDASEMCDFALQIASFDVADGASVQLDSAGLSRDDFVAGGGTASVVVRIAECQTSIEITSGEDVVRTESLANQTEACGFATVTTAPGVATTSDGPEPTTPAGGVTVPSDTTAQNPSTPTTTTAAGSGALPATGSASAWLISAALALTTLGGALALLARSRTAH